MNFVRAIGLLVCVSPIFAQYGGPAILVRGQAPAAMTASQIDFQPFLAVYGSYYSGLGGVSVDAQGKPVNDSSYGINASAGISGLHSWKHTKLGLDYRISAAHNPQASFYDGITQNLTLGITHMLSRHAMFSLHTGAGISSQNNAGVTLLSTVPFDPSTLYRPTNDFYDNRTIYLTSQAAVTIQKSTRLSYSLGVDGFLTRRRSTALYGVGGLGARGDVQYRVARRSTIGVAYNYVHFAFNGIFSSTDDHTFVGTFSRHVDPGHGIHGLRRCIPIRDQVRANSGSGSGDRGADRHLQRAACSLRCGHHSQLRCAPLAYGRKRNACSYRPGAR